MKSPCCYTIGHSTRAAEEFIALLREHGIDMLIDIRRYPASRRYPQFNKPLLMQALHHAGFNYLHEGALGGRRPVRQGSPNEGWTERGLRGYADYMASGAFQEALERLLGYARTTVPAIMCAEAVPWRCHRQLIADALLARGCAVTHILGPLQTRPHILTPFAAVVEGARLVYPKHGQPPLPFPDQQP